MTVSPTLVDAARSSPQLDPCDRALRQAQLHAADLQPHPFYRGSFSYLVNPLTTTRQVRTAS